MLFLIIIKVKDKILLKKYCKIEIFRFFIDFVAVYQLKIQESFERRNQNQERNFFFFF